MKSHRHNRGDGPGPDTRSTGDDALLDAARAAIVAVGWRRSTLTDIARRAGVSRMTIYRRWPDTQTLLADLMTREWSGVVEDAALTEAATVRERLVGGVVATVRALRGNELFLKIVEVDPELLLPYLLDRRGRTQEAILALLEAAVTEGQAEGSIRAGDPVLLARSVVLACHGFALSAQTMVGGNLPGEPTGPDETDLEEQLRTLVDRYLRP